MDWVRPINVEAREGYRIWLEYADGVSGEVDLSDVAGEGIFKAWDDRAFFESVHLTPHRAIAWNDEIDLCADALYMDLAGCTWEEMYPRPQLSEPINTPTTSNNPTEKSSPPPSN